MKNFRHHQQRPKKNMLISGSEAVFKAIKEGKPLEKIYLQANINASWVPEIKSLAREWMIPVHKVPVEKLNSLHVIGHDGCIAQIARVLYHDLQQIIDVTVERGEVPLFLMLDGITDIRNIGGIARSAYAMGVQAIIIPERGVGTLNEDAMLTSAGALENIAVCRERSLMKAVDTLHLNGIKVYATEMQADTKISDCDFTIPCAIVMGAEETGIYPALLKICDEKCKIPMTGNFDSLNVSVATGIVLYEVVRQRRV